MPGTFESQVSHSSLNGWRQEGEIALTHFCRNQHCQPMAEAHKNRMHSGSVNSFLQNTVGFQFSHTIHAQRSQF